MPISHVTLSLLIAVPSALVTMTAHAGPTDLIYADDFESQCTPTVYAEDFDVADGADWPSPWQVSGNVALADVLAGASRLRPGPTGYSLARMYAPMALSDVDVTFTFEFEDIATQGIGFYVRTNGGYLAETDPVGQGYAIFLEGDFRGQPGVSVWKEDGGDEIQLRGGNGDPAPEADTRYSARLQVEQVTPTQTQLRGRLWLATDSEPTTWQVEHIDATPALQNLIDGIAIDSWSSRNSAPIDAHTLVDDIVVQSLCP